MIFFFRWKIKEDDLYQKTLGNMIFSVYMHKCYKRDIALLQKKQRCSGSKKVHLGVTSQVSPRKMILPWKIWYFCWNTILIDTLQSSIRTQRCSIRKGILRNIAKSTGKGLCQSLFFNKVTGLRSRTLLKNRPGAGAFL